MSSTTQNSKNNSKDFSERLKELSAIKNANYSGTPFSKIHNSHGAFATDKQGNVFFDLRISKDKPFWGHSHPIILSHGRLPETEVWGEVINLENYSKHQDYSDMNLILEGLEFLDNEFLSADFLKAKNIFIQIIDHYYLHFKEGKLVNYQSVDKDIFDYITTVVLKGGYAQKRKKALQDFSQENQIDIIGLNLIFSKSQFDLELSKECCILIGKDNFIDDKVYLNFPLSFTGAQFKDCLERVTNCLRK